MTVRNDRALCLAVSFFCAGAALWGGTITYDLSAAWDDIMSTGNNGSSGWSVKFCGQAMPVGDLYWAGGALGLSVGAVPGVLRASADDFLPGSRMGDIIAHVGYGCGNYLDIVWTSPTAGIVDIAASLWHAANYYGHEFRATNWQLVGSVGNKLASGTFGGELSDQTYYGPYNRLALAIHYGLALSAGDTLVLRLSMYDNWTGAPAFAGVNFAVTLETCVSCDDDRDGDGLANAGDNCPNMPNPDQADDDGDGIGNACDDDRDGDGRGNAVDNCPNMPNPDQADADRDGIGDPCDDDRDGDERANAVDNCPNTRNPNQADDDGDGIGNACDDDRDGDGLANAIDNCPDMPSQDQADADADGVGDICDNCPNTPNPGQEDRDWNSIGDACDAEPRFSFGFEGAPGPIVTGLPGTTLVFPVHVTLSTSGVSPPNGVAGWSFGVESVGCVISSITVSGVIVQMLDDPAPLDLARADFVITKFAELATDPLRRGVISAVVLDIMRGRGVLDPGITQRMARLTVEVTIPDDPGGANIALEFRNGLAVPGEPPVSNVVVYLGSSYPGKSRTPAEGRGRRGDDREEQRLIPTLLGCFFKAMPDRDGDGIPDAVDLCPSIPGASNGDLDGDGIGDACDEDIDGDGVLNAVDNCALVPNADQADSNADGVGDACGASFRRGDANASGQVDIADAIFVLSYLFAQGQAPSCGDAADANDDEMIDIADAIKTLSHLFARAGPLAVPFDSCGSEALGDNLDCLRYVPCES